ncbi:hypothetical protein BDA96_06G009500 [Sorghum bicolor]|uniref:Uncharacterized protein n=2 Tax=Sorghum bicolor TaxID=4558 RepID=A0A921QNC9_SORBI|nr:hypothetical protein BDA96_06G009500 [Sorghum bicolor]OQU81102.1 hypothetical protein SORBI_3006G008650 [Sorghum bicolor]
MLLQPAIWFQTLQHPFFHDEVQSLLETRLFARLPVEKSVPNSLYAEILDMANDDGALQVGQDATKLSFITSFLVNIIRYMSINYYYLLSCDLIL